MLGFSTSISSGRSLPVLHVDVVIVVVVVSVVIRHNGSTDDGFVRQAPARTQWRPGIRTLRRIWNFETLLQVCFVTKKQ